MPCQNPAYEPGRPLYARRSRPADRSGQLPWRRYRPSRTLAPRSVGGETAALIFCPVVLWQLAGSAGVSGMVRLVALDVSGEDARVASRPGQPGADPGMARCGPVVGGVIAVAGAAGSGTAVSGGPG